MLVASGFLLQTGSASADPLPWTWVEVTATGSVGTVVTAICPDGYRAVTGGITDGAENRRTIVSGPDYSVLSDSGPHPQYTVTAWCALSSQLDVTIVDHTVTAPIFGSGDYWGHDDLACDNDQTPLSASVTTTSIARDWIIQSGPETIGSVNEWYVALEAVDGGDTADVQLLCVPNLQLPGASWVSQSTTNTGASADETVSASCPAQQRMITGGEHVDAITPAFLTSAPVDGSTWTSTMWVPNGDSLTVSVLCAPAGDPVAAFTSTPPEFTNSTSATFDFTAVDPAGGAAYNYCFLNTSGLGQCSDGYTVNDLSEGQNVFSIEAYTDDGRGWATTEKDYYFWVDLTAPTATLDALPRFTLSSDVPLHADGRDNEGIDHYVVSVSSWSTSDSAASPMSNVYDIGPAADLPLKAVPGRSYQAWVTAYDQAGNASVDTGASVLTGVPLDNAALKASKQWSLVKGKAFTHRLVSRTRAHGATLRHTMYGNTLGLVATTCKACGAVGIYIGKHLIKRVSLHATKTHHRRLFTVSLSKGEPVQTKVTVKVLSHNKRVEIDGLGAVIDWPPGS
jgi:hypothetical protein